MVSVTLKQGIERPAAEVVAVPGQRIAPLAGEVVPELLARGCGRACTASGAPRRTPSAAVRRASVRALRAARRRSTSRTDPGSTVVRARGTVRRCAAAPRNEFRGCKEPDSRPPCQRPHARSVARCRRSCHSARRRSLRGSTAVASESCGSEPIRHSPGLRHPFHPQPSRRCVCHLLQWRT